MGLYDDDDAAISEGPVDNEDFYLAMVHHKWLDVAMKQRMKEDGIKKILETIAGHVAKAQEKFPQHKDLIAWKAKVDKIMGKLDPSTQAWGGNIQAATPGWHQDVYRKGWADGYYALYLHDQKRTAEAKERAGNFVWRIKDSWMKEGDYTGHACYPKQELEELLAKVEPIAQ